MCSNWQKGSGKDDRQVRGEQCEWMLGTKLEPIQGGRWVAMTTAVVWSRRNGGLEVVDHSGERRLDKFYYSSGWYVGSPCEATWWVVEPFTEMGEEWTWRSDEEVGISNSTSYLFLLRWL